jgi:soluble lytic murein transglycosylase-like protein
METVGAPQGTKDLITKWSTHYGVNTNWMLRVAQCESGYRPDAVNGHYWAPDGSTPTGLFQFVRSTYTANAARIGLPAQDDRLDPDRAAQVAAWMFSINQSNQWACK